MKLFLSLLLFALPLFSDFKLEKLSAAPDVPAALKEQVQAQGIRILNDAGQPYAEIWLAKALNAEAKAPGAEVFYTGIPEGAFLGVWRFAIPGSDFRGQPVKAGLYSMRYELMPADGNHMGAAQYRDFLLLLPVVVDDNPSALVKFDQAVALSRKASGTGHPAVFPLLAPEGSGEATLAKSEHNWVVRTQVPARAGAALPVAFIVFGKAEQ